MKIKLEKNGLIITPESYVEQLALKTWSEKNDASNGCWLIEAYTQQSAHTDAPSMCPHGRPYDELCKPCGRVPDPSRASNTNH